MMDFVSSEMEEFRVQELPLMSWNVKTLKSVAVFTCNITFPMISFSDIYHAANLNMFYIEALHIIYSVGLMFGLFQM